MCRVIVLILALGLAAGCADRTAPPTPAARSDPEAVVRAAIAHLFRVDPAGIDMNRPLSEPPLKADELDLVELVMEVEDQLGVEIADDQIEKAAEGKLGGGPVRLTPADLVRLAREAKPGPKARAR